MVAGAWSFSFIQAGEAFYFQIPRIPKPSKPPIIFLPQASGTADQYRDGGATPNYGKRAQLMRRMSELGHFCVTADFGGQNTFGNATVKARIDTVWNWMQTNIAATPYLTVGMPAILFGCSMGNISAVNWARANPTKVRGIINCFGMVDLTGSYETNLAGLQAAIGAAWGVTYPTPLPAGADPVNNVSEIVNIPWRGWYAQDDPLIDPVEYEAYADLFNDGIAYNAGMQGHDDDVVAYGFDAIVQQMEAWSS